MVSSRSRHPLRDGIPKPEPGLNLVGVTIFPENAPEHVEVERGKLEVETIDFQVEDWTTGKCVIRNIRIHVRPLDLAAFADLLHRKIFDDE